MATAIISQDELAVLAKHGDINTLVVHGYGVDPTLEDRFITYYTVQVNDSFLYRADAVKPGDNLQALVGWKGFGHGPNGRGPNTNPFEFESVEQIAELLSGLGIPEFSVSSYIHWSKVHVSFDV